MSADVSATGTATGRARLSLNQATIKHTPVDRVVELALAEGIEAVGLWREDVADYGLEKSAALTREKGLRVSSLCRGGFFTTAEPAAREAALQSNLDAIDEAAVLGAPTLVLVAGGLPDGDKDLPAARERARQMIAALVPHAVERGVSLAIEPMHPIFTADRGVVATLGQALDIAESFPDLLADGRPAVAAVVDTYHVWWDPDLFPQIARAGRTGRIASYQVCDWMTPLCEDSLLSRGYMGDGHIDFRPVTEAVVAAGYDGDVEVEIFRQEIWDDDPAHVTGIVAERFTELVAPYC